MTALYRRYRPEHFGELIGQSHVTEPLRHALQANKTNHAYLFSGPRGCGKTTSARILARCLNCFSGPTDRPCGECPSCVELSRDGAGSLDVVEIDAASHNGVDDARELRERAVFAPARDRYKIFILDEAHMVTQQGFNALLKIVEEPPEHVKFIFATTEPDKVLPTIRSRTHHYPFRLVPPAEVLTYLERLVESEKMSVGPGVLSLVVRSGGGSIRDTLSILDQLMAGASGNEVTLENANGLLGFTPRHVLERILETLQSGNSVEAFEELAGVLRSGQDPRKFVEDLLGHLRDLIVAQATRGGSAELFPGVPAEEMSRWEKQADFFAPAVLYKMAEVVSQRLSEMSGITSPTLQLELLLAQLLSLSGDSQQEMLVGTAESAETPSELRAANSSPFRPSNTAIKNQTAAEVATKREEEKALESGQLDTPPEALTLELLTFAWAAIMEDVSTQKRSVWVALSRARPMDVEGDVLSIGFANLSDAEILKKPQGPGSPLPNAEILRDVIQRHTGRRVRFTVCKLEEDTSAEPLTQSDSGWPTVSTIEQSASEADDGATGDERERSAPSSEEEVTGGSEISPVATRGEPVVRQLLGGELVGEEILESKSQQGEADV